MMMAFFQWNVFVALHKQVRYNSDMLFFVGLLQILDLLWGF